MSLPLYFICTVSSGETVFRSFRRAIGAELKKYGVILDDHVLYDDPLAYEAEQGKLVVNVAERDMMLADAAFAGVAEISVPTTGGGAEIMMFAQDGRSLLVLHHKDVRGSWFVRDMNVNYPNIVHKTYSTKEEAVMITREFLERVKGEYEKAKPVVQPNFVVIDGLDGVGKGKNLEAVVEFYECKGLRVFDLHKWWASEHCHPQFEFPLSPKGNSLGDYVDLDSFDVLISAEPTFVGVGAAIRDEVIRAKGRYSSRFTAGLYSADRLVLYNRVVLPALRAGKRVIQSRSVSTSIAYQPVQAGELGEQLRLGDILKLEGNAFALRYPPRLLVVPTVFDFDELERRLRERVKDDQTWFEGVAFQRKLAPQYVEGGVVDRIFSAQGALVLHIDNGKSVEHTKDETKRVLEFFESQRV